MDETFYAQDLENMIIKDKEYFRKKKKIFLSIFIPLLFFIVILSIILYFTLRHIGGKIICKYETTKDNENVHLISKTNDINFRLIIDDSSYSGNNYHSFEKAGIHTVIFHFKNKLESLDGFFEGITNLIEIDFSELETENIRSMTSTFSYCKNLKKVNIDKQIPNLEDISYMFFGCESLITPYLNFDTSKVKRMDYMFYNCQEIINLDLSNFNLENLHNGRNMFTSCFKLKEIKFKDNIKTNNLEEMTGIFSHCESLDHINTKIFNIKNVKNLNYIFENCNSLKEIDLSHFETQNIEEAVGTFKNCKNLESLDVSNFDISKIKKITQIFYGCTNLKTLNIPPMNTNELFYTKEAFYDCQSLTSLDLSSLNFGSVISAKKMFYNCINLENLIMPNKMTSLVRTDNMFENCYKLNSINLGFLENTSDLVVAEGMFKNCEKLTEIQFPNIDTINLDNTNEMFSGCLNIKSINLEGLKARNITSISKMFSNCKNLEYLNIFNACTKNADKIDSIFEGIEKNINIVLNTTITSNELIKQIPNITSES